MRIAGGERMQAVAVGARARVEIDSYDASTHRDTVIRRTGDAASGDAVADRAFDNITRVIDYYATTFGRNSFDNKGTVVKVRVHAPDATSGQVPANNAYWFNDEKRIWLGDGDGVQLGHTGDAVDVVGHEFTHGVIDSEIELSTIGQEGGLHESFSDVMATGLDNNWTIAETVYTPGIAGDALRNLQNPVYDDYRTMPSWVDDPHDLADIPNHAAYKVAEQLGADTMRRIWYTALTDNLKSHSGFGGAAQATLSAAERMFGKHSKELQAVRDAWTAVGVDENTPMERQLTAAERFSIKGIKLLAIGR
jgi:Zn-dependent metalloprotease